ncbi:43625_t:CDS:2, partial [Gigaspora margarita]
ILNTQDTQVAIEKITKYKQRRPANWPKEFSDISEIPTEQSGFIGDDKNGTFYINCPMHKKNFVLENSECLSSNIELKLMTFNMKLKDNYVWFYFPLLQELNRLLGSSKWIVTKDHIARKKSKETGVQIVRSAVNCSSASCSDKKLDW